ncbi:kelch-like protein 12 [Aplysia californica]|uniref:Kelch-like protein 12 n=1 Tax=Aplysia californica TaxID=6500 RepID=A0ABM0JA46_APLCA|nr:kelch-like protein 12 [Aplysia californica]
MSGGVLSMRPQQKVLLEGLESLYSENCLCDVSLQAESTRVDVHKCILAASSPYFRAMFTFDTRESPQHVVKLHNVSGFVLEDLVKFFYTGDIVLTDSNVQALVTAAEMMQITALRDQCELFMSSALCTENCVEVYNFADFQNLERLKCSAEAYLLENFQELYDKEAFLKMRLQNLSKIISSDDLNVSQEEVVLESVLRWMKYDLDQRKKDLILLLLSIRFPLMSFDYIENTVCTEPLISENPFCNQLVREAKNYKTAQTKAGDWQCQFQFSYKPRLGMCSKKMLIFSGGAHNAKDRAFCCFDPDTKLNFYSIKQHPSFDFKCKIDFYKLIVTDNSEIFFLGGIFYDDYHFEPTGAVARSTVLVYNQKASAWQECASMKAPKCAFGACYYSGRIFVFGGYSMYPGHTPTQDVTGYDVSSDEWSQRDDMPVEMAHQATTVFRDKAYIFGGVDAENMYLNTVLQYTFSNDQWTLVNVEMPRPQAEAVAITHDSKIFILGGCNSAGNILSVLIFDPETRRWVHGEDFPDDRKFTSVTKGDNCIFVCGGVRHFISRTGSFRRSKTVETKDLFRYDISRNKWSKETRFVEYGSNVACAFASINVKHLNVSSYVEDDI